MDISKSSELWSSKIVRVFNSTLCFCSAYITITYLYWFVHSLVGKFFQFDSFVYYYGIKFLLNYHSWNRLNVGLIFSSGPAFLLLFGALSIYFFDKFKNFKTTANLFLVWGFVLGTTMFCAQFLIAAIGLGEYNSPFYQAFAVVFAWVRIPAPLVYLFVIPAGILYVYFMVHYGKPFLRLAYSYTRVNKLSRKRKFFLETAIVPFLIGSVGLTYLTFPLNLFVHLTYMASILVALVGTWIAMPYIEVLKDDVLRYKNLQQMSYIFVVLLALLVAFVNVTFRGLFMSA